MNRHSVLSAVIALHVVGCRGGSAPAVEQGLTGAPTAAETDTLTSAEFPAILGIALDSMTETLSGVYVQDVEVGSGAVATVGKRVTVEYRAWLPDGTLYEERPNADGWGASEFVLGPEAPVPGLVQGIEGMRAGGVRRIIVPAELGYGLVGRPAGVPAGSDLVFRVHLIRVHDE